IRPIRHRSFAAAGRADAEGSRPGRPQISELTEPRRSKNTPVIGVVALQGHFFWGKEHLVSIETPPSCSNSFTGVQSEPTADVQPRSAAFKNVQKCSEMIAHHEMSKTKPNSPAKPLTSRQLAAARLACQ